MRLSYNWLREFVSLPQDITPQKVAEQLTLHTAEIEGITDLSKQLQNVVAGRIVEFVPHPKKEGLYVAKVLVGTGMLQIVFGSVHEVHPGDVLPIALPGAQLPNLTIEKRTVYGIESEGMIADDKELGIQNSISGLTRMAPDTVLGTPLSSVLQLQDTVFEIENKAITHRPDLWSQYGFARELAALYGTELVSYLPDNDHKYLGIITGKILEVTKHPNADKLRLAKVDVGTDTLSIVCGATNIKPGQIVPVATLGTRMPDGLEIKKAKIRDVESFGMLCSPYELQLGVGRGVILLLSDQTPIGIPLREALQLKKVLSDRNRVNAILEDSEGCTRFTTVVVDTVDTSESPQWLKARLQASGVRPINCIVDITNYVMLELGQPMHAYDRELLASDTFTVIQAKEGQTIKTLDGIARTLLATASLVMNGRTAIGIGGIMGGENTAIRPETKTVVFEAAHWNPVRIRRTMTSLGLRTEAGMRFEKDIAQEYTILAIQKALKLVFEICPNARQISPVTTVGIPAAEPEPILFDTNLTRSVTGTAIPDSATQSILDRLGFKHQPSGPHHLKVTRPWWRSAGDISIQADLVEEVARIYGYQQGTPSLPMIVMQPPLEDPFKRTLIRSLKQWLAYGGQFHEVMNYSFTGPRTLRALHETEDGVLKLKNPISDEHTALRTGLLGGLLENVADHIRKEQTMRCFEIGRVFHPEPSSWAAAPHTETTLPAQPLQLSGVVTGDDGFGIVKSAVQHCVDLLHAGILEFKDPEQVPTWVHPGRAAALFLKDHLIGGIGEIHPSVREVFDIPTRVFFFDISLDDLLPCAQRLVTFKELPKYPLVSRDLSLIADNKTTVSFISNIIAETEPLVVSVNLFDCYRGPQIGADKKSLSFSIHYQHAERTLTDDEVTVMHTRITDTLAKHGITTR